MRYKTTITPTEMRGINRTAILDIIRAEGPISRSCIAEKLQISLPTVIRLVDELIEGGLAHEMSEKEWSGGRKRSLVEFNAEGNLAIGIDLGGAKIYGAVVDFGGNVLFEKEIRKHQSTGEESFLFMVGLIRELLGLAENTRKCIRGIGVGAPGVTLPEEGFVDWAPSLQWKKFPLKQKLIDEFKLPVIIDNDVNLAALGEIWFGSGQQVENLVLISIGTGIGAGVIIDGAVFRGAHMSSGEIGYLLPATHMLGDTYRDFGALEQLASRTGIIQQARQVLQNERSQEQLDAMTVKDIFDAARKNEAWARTVIDSTVDYLAQAVAAVSLCFDPDLIVMGGEVAQAEDLFIDAILKRLDGRIPFRPSLLASKLGSRAVSMGAAIGLLYEISQLYVVRRLF